MNQSEYHLPSLVLSFRATVDSCRDVLAGESDRIMSIIKTLPCVRGDVADLHLALLEALANAVIHATGRTREREWAFAEAVLDQGSC
jgi:hypothetical protein